MTAPRNTAGAILTYIQRHGSAGSTELCEHLGITRQAVNHHVRRLIDSGDLVKSGSTRSARYFPASRAPKAEVFTKQYALDGLDEAIVYQHVAVTLNLGRGLRTNVERAANYAFTEMLNNAIDHSGAVRCRVAARLEAGRVGFEIRDPGVGVFRSIADKHHLPDEHAAMIELLKGKTTTMPEAHSGEGIFFSSRAVDHMVLRSHRIAVEWDRARDDVFVSSPRHARGTTVAFEIRRDSRRRLEDVFDEFAPEAYDYQFRKTRVLVKLLRPDYLSRSEAKRLLHRLDRFALVELDLRGVEHLGQGFADEIFRVFASLHPGVELRILNAREAVAAMVRHVRQAGDRANEPAR